VNERRRLQVVRLQPSRGRQLPACDAATVLPATVTVALRDAPVLAPAVTPTLADPFPDVTLVVSQGVPFETVHPQVLALAVMLTLAVPPPFANETEVGDTV
jgi:hypothetical protein